VALIHKHRWLAPLLLLAPGLAWLVVFFLVPLGGDVPTASTYMNFVYDPKIAAQISIGNGYISSVKGVREEAIKLDPASANNPLIFPSDEILSNVVQFDSAALNNQTYIEKWQKLLGA